MKTILTLLGVFFIALSGCRKSEPPPPAVKPAQGPPTVELTDEGIRNAEVRTALVSRVAFAPRLSVVATLEPDPHHVARVGARVGGRVASIESCRPHSARLHKTPTTETPLRRTAYSGQLLATKLSKSCAAREFSTTRPWLQTMKKSSSKQLVTYFSVRAIPAPQIY